MSARRQVAVALVIALPLAGLLLSSAGLLGGPVSWVVVAGSSMEPSLQAGDIAFVLRQPSYARGDVVAYRVPRADPGAGLVVIHRIVGGSEAEGYVVRGDTKPGVDPWRPRAGDVLGKLVLDIPGVGLSIASLRSPLGLALVAGIVAAAAALGSGSPPSARTSPGFTRTLPRA